MSQTARQLLTRLVLIGALAVGLLLGAVWYGMSGLWAVVQRFDTRVADHQQTAFLVQEMAMAFKGQVHEWKSVLLRFEDTEQSERHWLAFEQRESDVARLGLQILAFHPREDVRHAIDTFLTSHTELGQLYRSVYADMRGSVLNVNRGDYLVSGHESSPSALLDRLVASEVERARHETSAARQDANSALNGSLAGLIIGVVAGGVAFVVLIRRKVFAPTQRVFAERDRATEQLMQTERMAALGGLVAGVAHEVNTPVGVTLTCASHLHEASQAFSQKVANGAVRKQDMLAYLAQAEESSQIILKNALRAGQLVQSFKQIAVDQTSEARRVFPLKSYIDEVLLSLKPAWKHRAIEVRVQGADDVSMDSYPGPLGQVLTNLVMNAVTHAFDSEAGGEVRITITPQAGRVLLVVQDNGSGIPREHLGKIFDPFFTTRRGMGGTGLGLSVVYNTVTRILGGSIEVHSTLGDGAMFALNLPQTAPGELSLNTEGSKA